MSKEQSLYEKLGGTYTDVDGILYPDLGMVNEPKHVTVGKYGLLWISYMKENHPDRYSHHIRMRQLQGKVAEVNEEAYQMLDTIMNRYLQKHKPVNTNSTMEMWKLREQAMQTAEEEVYETVVYRFY